MSEFKKSELEEVSGFEVRGLFGASIRFCQRFAFSDFSEKFSNEFSEEFSSLRSCSQFHQHFTYEQLFRQYYFPKKLQSQNVSRYKLHNALLYTKKSGVKCWWNKHLLIRLRFEELFLWDTSIVLGCLRFWFLKKKYLNEISIWFTILCICVYLINNRKNFP